MARMTIGKFLGLKCVGIEGLVHRDRVDDIDVALGPLKLKYRGSSRKCWAGRGALGLDVGAADGRELRLEETPELRRALTEHLRRESGEALRDVVVPAELLDPVARRVQEILSREAQPLVVLDASGCGQHHVFDATAVAPMIFENPSSQTSNQKGTSMAGVKQAIQIAHETITSRVNGGSPIKKGIIAGVLKRKAVMHTYHAVTALGAERVTAQHEAKIEKLAVDYTREMMPERFSEIPGPAIWHLGGVTVGMQPLAGQCETAGTVLLLIYVAPGAVSSAIVEASIDADLEAISEDVLRVFGGGGGSNGAVKALINEAVK